MNNIPNIKLGIIAVSRDCFPISLSASRRDKVAKAFKGDIYNCNITVENEIDARKAVDDVLANGVNALVVFLGNFGPETPETMIAQFFGGPVMYVAAAEESGDTLIDGRGDAYCGMLNCSYNLSLRNIKAYIPANPVGTADEIAENIEEFIPIATAVLGMKNLKIITFGPRPQDFFSCNAPLKQLYELGVEVEENSELDLLASFNEHKNDSRIDAVAKDMAQELGKGNTMPDLLKRLAQFELTLLDWIEAHKGSRKYVALANKCWPAFQTEFGFVPCYVNSRLAASGIPVACEVDIYGALSEYIGVCVSGAPVTLLDINNTVPRDIYESDIKAKYSVKLSDTFMGFHCGNTPICRLKKAEMRYQLIMKRCLEPDGEPNISRGTLEGDIAASNITFYRLQGALDGSIKAYISEGEVLDVETRSFGGIGVFYIPEMARFYRNVLLAKQFPHHGAVAFGHYGKAIFDVFKYFGVDDIGYNQPAGLPYPNENPF